MSERVLMQLGQDIEPRYYTQWELTIEAIRNSQYRDKRFEEWLSSRMAQILEPDIFLRAYGNPKCQSDVANYLEQKGFELVIHEGTGRTDLCQNGKVIDYYVNH